MTARRLLGTVLCKDGWISLYTGKGIWYPLGGASGIANDFRETFGEAQLNDVGRRLYRQGEFLAMESHGQRDARIAEEMEKDR